MTSFWLDQLRRTVWKGCAYSFLFYGGQDTNSQKKHPDLPKYCQILSFHLSQGQHRLSPERKQAVCSIPAPKTHQQIRKYLGAVGFCQIWIPNYSLLVIPLYEATKGGEQEPLVWGREQEKALKEIKKHSLMPLL
jgi:hypothetical protein